MALELTIICAVTGAVLALWYNVLVLVPAVMFAMLFAVIVGIARADSFWSIVLLTAVLGVAVQLGYLAGAAIHAVVGSICAALGRSRNHELSGAMVPYWPPAWHAEPLRITVSTPRVDLLRLQPPQV